MVNGRSVKELLNLKSLRRSLPSLNASGPLEGRFTAAAGVLRRRAWALTATALIVLSCARATPPTATDLPAEDQLPSPSTATVADAPADPVSEAEPALPPADAAPPTRPAATLSPRFELALSLPWGSAGLTDPRPSGPGRRHSMRRRVPGMSVLRDGSLWLQSDLFSAVLVKRGVPRRLPFTAAGLEWYLASAALPAGVLLLGRTSRGPSLVRLDARGSPVHRHDLPEPDAGPPLNAYGLLQDDATGEVYLWSAYERQLRRVSPGGDPLGRPLAVGAPATSQHWWIHRGQVEWITVDDAAATPVIELHSAPIDGSAASSIALDLARPEGPYDPVRSYGGLDLRNDLRLPRGRLPDGTMLFAGSSLVWVRPEGGAALSVSFEAVVRAGDGVAFALSESSPGIAARVERWVAGQEVAVVRPTVRDAHGAGLLSADASGFELYIENRGACMPGSGGFPNQIASYSWSSAEPLRTRGVGCSEEARDEISDRGGAALPDLATTAPDGSVLVPGADQEGIFIVRLRTSPVP